MKGLVNQKWSPIPANHGTLPSLSVETSISCYCNCHTAMSHFQPFHSALSDTFTILKQAHRITANELKQLNWTFTNQLNGQSHMFFACASPMCNCEVRWKGRLSWCACHVHCRAQNVSHAGHMANQTIVQLITCVTILSVLLQDSGEIHAMQCPEGYDNTCTQSHIHSILECSGIPGPSRCIRKVVGTLNF